MRQTPSSATLCLPAVDDVVANSGRAPDGLVGHACAMPRLSCLALVVVLTSVLGAHPALATPDGGFASSSSSSSFAAVAPVVHRFVQARDSFEQARQADPAFGGADVQRAIEGYRRAVGFDVDHAQYRNYLGAALLSAGDATGAVRVFWEAVRLAPNEAKYLVNLGYAWHRAGNEVRALVWYQRAVALADDDVRAHLFAGYALQNLGMRAEAVTEFEAVVRLAPGHAAASQALRRLGVAQPIVPDLAPLDAPPMLGNPPPGP
jgi:tetratricopeptide (TPR) repeat protein